MPNLTAAEVFAANKGVGPGFDALRLGLSVWVFTLHAAYICQGAEGVRRLADTPLHNFVVTPVLPMFFMVSGYLVTGSAIRTRNLFTFLMFRILRILPALLVEVTLSALVLGPWLTEKSLAGYFSDTLLYKYFLNIFGVLHLLLPGLFLQNPLPHVNANLWTLRPEYYCYIIMSILIFSGVIFDRRKFTAISFLVLTIVLGYVFFGGQPYNFFGLPDWKMLIVSFFLGCLAYHWNDRIVISKWYALLALLTAGIALMHPVAIVAGFLAMIYITVYIGAQPIKLPYFLKWGDYSYGVYLFGFPIQQAVVYFLRLEYRSGLIVMAVGLPLTFIFAMLSWRLVEKPALRLKKLFKADVDATHRSAPDARFDRALAAAGARSPDPAIG